MIKRLSCLVLSANIALGWGSLPAFGQAPVPPVAIRNELTPYDTADILVPPMRGNGLRLEARTYDVENIVDKECGQIAPLPNAFDQPAFCGNTSPATRIAAEKRDALIPDGSYLSPKAVAEATTTGTEPLPPLPPAPAPAAAKSDWSPSTGAVLLILGVVLVVVWAYHHRRSCPPDQPQPCSGVD